MFSLILSGNQANIREINELANFNSTVKEKKKTSTLRKSYTNMIGCLVKRNKKRISVKLRVS